MPTLSVPGDKSITHRALLLAALAPGESRIRGPLASLDTAATATALRALGAVVSPLDAPVVRVTGRQRLAQPAGPLDCANSGTTARLLAGILAAHLFDTRLTGDASLRRRPMRRITAPLTAMGAAFDPDTGTLPFTVRGAALRPIRWTLPVASAQAKSAILLAAALAGVEAELIEPAVSRDHTERMLRRLGFPVTALASGTRLLPGGAFTPLDTTVPGDLSSAAFLAGAATLAPRGELRVTNVGLNPTRTGFIGVLARMGGACTIESQRNETGEPVGDILVRPAALHATTVEPLEVPLLIDELPILAVLAARAAGTTVFRGVAELRVKESDRVELLAANLRALGVAVEAGEDELSVTGTEAPPSGQVRTGGDHRIAMAFQVLGTVPGARVMVDDLASAAVSYPGFEAALRVAAGQVNPRRGQAGS